MRQNKHTVACVCVWLGASYLPQVLHAAMYAIKMNVEVFCQPRTRPCLMRYNPLEAGILLSLSLFLSFSLCFCCSYLFHLAFNCFAYVNQLINVKFNWIRSVTAIPLLDTFHTTCTHAAYARFDLNLIKLLRQSGRLSRYFICNSFSTLFMRLSFTRVAFSYFILFLYVSFGHSHSPLAVPHEAAAICHLHTLMFCTRSESISG